MSDGSISQDEIDALLGLSGGGGGAASSNTMPDGSQLSNFKQNALSQFVNGNLSGLSSNLDSMMGTPVSILDTSIELTEREAFLRKLPEEVTATLINFSGALTGEHVFILAPELSKKIVSLVNQEENVEIDDMALSVISETIAQHVGTEVTALESSGLSGVTSNPAESQHIPKAMLRLPQHNFVSITYNIQIDGVSYKLWEVLPEVVANTIIEKIAGSEPANTSADMSMGGMQGMNNPGMPQQGMFNQGMQGMQNGFQNFGSGMQGNMGAMPNMGMQGMMNGMPQGGMGMQGGMMPMQNMGMNTNVQSVQFPQLQGFSPPEQQGNIGLIMDVYMEMTVELGRTKKMIKEILGIGEGHIIELDKLAGEPVDVLVNHKPIAKGEVVIIEESFGVRITEILSPAERIADV